VADKVVHGPEAVISTAYLTAEQRMSSVFGGAGDFQGSRGEHRGDKFCGIGVGRGLPGSHNGYAIGTARISEQRELLVCLHFELPVGQDSQRIQAGPSGQEAVGDCLGVSRLDLMQARHPAHRPTRETSGRISQAIQDDVRLAAHRDSPHSALDLITVQAGSTLG
jgi:hypothetical protein